VSRIHLILSRRFPQRGDRITPTTNQKTMHRSQSIKKQNGKNGQGDLVLKHVYLKANLIIDVALIHEFESNHMADVIRNGELQELRNADPAKLLEATARPAKLLEATARPAKLLEATARPAKLLEATARTKVRSYRGAATAYAARLGVSYAFLPCVMSPRAPAAPRWGGCGGASMQQKGRRHRKKWADRPKTGAARGLAQHVNVLR